MPVAASVEPNLRRLGVPTRLVKGRVVLDTGEGGRGGGFVGRGRCWGVGRVVC